LANHGTLLLDEIGELSLEAQTKLLRVLEEKEFYPVGSNELVKVDVRIIASTNRNLEEMVEQKLFREDLFFRLNVYPISIPSLKERPKDIISIAEYFVKEYNVKFGKNFQEISSEAKKRLLNHPWRGNVRELRNMIERVILSEDASIIDENHFLFIKSPSPNGSADIALKLSDKGIDKILEEEEMKLLKQVLENANGNKTKAAKLVKLSLPAFYYRLEKYGLA